MSFIPVSEGVGPDKSINYHIGLAAVVSGKTYCHPAHDQHLLFIRSRFWEICPAWFRGTPLLTVGATLWFEGKDKLDIARGVGRPSFSARDHDVDIDVFVEMAMYRDVDEAMYRHNILGLLDVAFDRLAKRIAKRAPEVDPVSFISTYRSAFQQYREAALPIRNPNALIAPQPKRPKSTEVYLEFQRIADRSEFCRRAQSFGFEITLSREDGLYLCTMSRLGSPDQFQAEIDALYALCEECGGVTDGFAS